VATIFPGLSRTWNFKEKNPGLCGRRGNPDEKHTRTKQTTNAIFSQSHWTDNKQRKWYVQYADLRFTHSANTTTTYILLTIYYITAGYLNTMRMSLTHWNTLQFSTSYTRSSSAELASIKTTPNCKIHSTVEQCHRYHSNKFTYRYVYWQTIYGQTSSEYLLKKCIANRTKHLWIVHLNTPCVASLADTKCGPLWNSNMTLIHWAVVTLTFDHLTSKAYCCFTRLIHSLCLKFVWLLVS